MIEQESDSDEEEDSSDGQAANDEGKKKDERVGATDKIGADPDGKGSDDGSICSEEDILNRSLQSDCDEAIESGNYLRYASDKYAQKQDLLEIVDKNERSFK
jgi:hypothetical protein